MKRLLVFLVVLQCSVVSFSWSNDNMVIGGGSSPSWEKRSSSSAPLGNGVTWATRSSHCAVRLQNGNVFLAGGSSSPGTWEILDANGALVSSTGTTGVTLWATRDQGFSCTLLQNGNVMIAGGNGSSGTWEIHDANGNLMSSTGSTGLYLWPAGPHIQQHYLVMATSSLREDPHLRLGRSGIVVATLYRQQVQPESTYGQIDILIAQCYYPVATSLWGEDQDPAGPGRSEVAVEVL
jgi:hypothetical protein